jgi:MSHA pilin protein MshA
MRTGRKAKLVLLRARQDMNNQNILLKSQKGFTLIELVMIIVILGILAAVAIPTYINLSGNAQAATAHAVLGSFRAANAIILANNAVTNNAAAWNWTSIIASAVVQGATVGVPAAAGNTVTIQVGNSTFTFTLSPTTPSIGAPATISANIATW